jgi:Phosphotransferase enzyme family
MLEDALSAYNIPTKHCTIIPFGSGLINLTWKIIYNNKEYILQQINEQIFTQPNDIALNIDCIAKFLDQHHPSYLFVNAEKTNQSNLIFKSNQNKYYRLMPFVTRSHTTDVVSNTHQAFEAAKQFGKFTLLLNNFNANQLKITLPQFHNLTLRYQQFEQAILNGNKKRILQAEKEINFLINNKFIVDTYEEVKNNPLFKQRVTHHDTKISNVLFDENDNGLCVIDLDTVMPGYFISDVGDMMRTYLSPANEEEKDFEKIVIREDYFSAIVNGYLSQMKNELSETEMQYFIYAGKFMIYMQALRFITDYLNNDIYYGAKYEGHNFMRGQNQINLLQKLINKEGLLNNLVLI